MLDLVDGITNSKIELVASKITSSVRRLHDHLLPCDWARGESQLIACTAP